MNFPVNLLREALSRIQDNKYQLIFSLLILLYEILLENAKGANSVKTKLIKPCVTLVSAIDNNGKKCISIF